MIRVLSKIPASAEPPAIVCDTHALAKTEAVTVDLDFDEDSRTFVTYVKELHGMSTFGDSESQALDNTAEMIRGYIKSMGSSGKPIPLSAGKLADLKRAFGSS